MNRTHLSAAAAALLLAGCVAEGPFPSLQPRPEERLDAEEPERQPEQVPDDPAVRARTAELIAQARAGDRDFESAYPPAAAAAAAAGPPESDGWVAAQEAISRAEAARAATMRALGDLDSLAIERAAVPTSDSDLAAIAAAVAEVERIAAAQQRRMDRLRGSIRR